MNQLPPNWTEASIGSICVDTEQVTPEAEVEFTYVDIGSVDRVTKRITSPQRLLGRDAPSRARKLIRTGDTIVSTTRPNLNAVALVDLALNDQIASTGFEVLRSPGLDPRWLGYLVRTSAFVEAMSSLVQGALYPAVRGKDVRSFVAPVAPSNEQKRIADKLDAVFTRVDAVNTRLARVAPILNRFRQSVLAAATSGRLTEDWRTRGVLPIEPNSSAEAPSRLPTTWVWKPMRKVTVCVDSKRVPIKASDRARREGPYPYYGAFGAIDSIDEYLFEGDYLLLAEDGKNLESRDRPIALIATGKFWVNNHAHVLQGREGMRLEYLLHWLNSESCDISDLLTGIDQIKLTRAAMDRIPVPVPPLDEQAEIVSRVEVLFTFAARVEARLRTAQIAAERLTPALLAKAFRGELVPQDPNDEPATQLLRRFKADRPASKSKQGRRAAV